MYSLEVINEMNREAGDSARDSGIEPYYLESIDQLKPPLPFPEIGDEAEAYDERYKRIDSLFCDMSGFGEPGERALTGKQLIAKLTSILEEHGPVYVAIEEVGQFQLYLGVWKEQQQ